MPAKFEYWKLTLLVVAFQAIHASRVDFYEHSEFKGRVLRVDVNSNCNMLPRNVIRKVSSIEACGCVKVYMDPNCSGESRSFNSEDVGHLAILWTEPKRYTRYWKNMNWNDKIVSYGPCESISDSDKLKDIATRYLQQAYKRTISVRELRRIGQ